MTESLQTAMKKLRLSGLAQSLDVRLQEAAGNSLSHAEFLELALQDELAVRNERLINRRIKAASFRELRTLEDRPAADHDQIEIFVAHGIVLRGARLSSGWVLTHPPLPTRAWAANSGSGVARLCDPGT